MTSLADLLKQLQDDSSSSDSDGDAGGAASLLGLMSGVDPVTRLLGSLAVLEGLSEALKDDSEGFRVGDMVRLNTDQKTVQRLQEGHGGWNNEMKQSLGKLGAVVKKADDLIVHIGKKTWRINPEACTKLSKDELKKMFKFGESIYVEFTDAIAKEMQKYHGGWDPLMEGDLQKVGRVIGPDDDGDVAVQFWTRAWRVNAAACKILTIETGCSFKVGDKVFVDMDVDMRALKTLQEDHKAWNPHIVRDIGRIGEVTEIDKDGDLNVKFRERKWCLNPNICSKILSMKLPGGDFFCIGDEVGIGVPADILKEMQKDHGEWHADMAKYIGQKGKVTGISPNGDVVAVFDKQRWRINAAACTRFGDARGPPFKVDQRIAIDLDPKEFLTLQIGHGGVSASILTDIGKVGKVLEIFEDRDVMVQFSPNMWCLNPAICTKLSDLPKPTFAQGDRVYIGLDVDIIKSLQKDHGGFVDTMYRLMGQVGRVLRVKPDGDLLVLYGILPLIVHSALMSSVIPVEIESKTTVPVNMNPFSSGDLVRIEMDLDQVKSLQQGHGGWNAEMDKIYGKVGIVDKIDGDGDVFVCYGKVAAHLNPAVLTLIRTDDVMDNTVTNPQAQSGGATADPGSTSTTDNHCDICKTRRLAVVFGCGHGTCEKCSKNMTNCHDCQAQISYKTKLDF